MTISGFRTRREPRHGRRTRFGFARTGNKVKERVKAALAIAVEKGLMTRDNGRLTVPE